MWKLKQIFDGEYGCEERQPGEKEKCLVILVNEEGEEKTFEANEDWIAAIEKLSANPLRKIIISKTVRTKRSWWRRKAMAIRRQSIQRNRCFTIILAQKICRAF